MSATGVVRGRSVSVRDMLGLRFDFSVNVMGGEVGAAGSEPIGAEMTGAVRGGSGCGG